MENASASRAGDMDGGGMDNASCIGKSGEVDADVSSKGILVSISDGAGGAD
jgi:hypothetical protein